VFFWSQAGSGKLRRRRDATVCLRICGISLVEKGCFRAKAQSSAKTQIRILASLPDP
jgi:hypothetical protein